MHPLVSISCVTYNHAKYIKQCLDSFLSQETTFPFEIVIHDDASTDGTTQIIEEYAKNYPDKIFPLIQKENQFSKGVRGIMAKFNLPRCRGKYIAWCEGDDYFTDNKKLQKQFDFLESNVDCQISFHNCQKIDTAGNNLGLVYDYLPKDFKLIDSFYGDYTKTCTVMFRKSDSIKNENIIGDITFCMELLRNGGKAQYINSVMSCYRVHEGGIWSQKKELERFKLAHYSEQTIKNNFYYNYSNHLDIRLRKFYIMYAFKLLKEREYFYSYYSFFQYFKYEKNKTELISNFKHLIKYTIIGLNSKINI